MTALVGVSPRDRRTLAVGLIIVGSLIAVTRGVPAWLHWVHDASAAATEQVRAAEDADALVAQSLALRDTMKARDARYLDLAPALVSGTTPADASASLASLLSAAAGGAHVTLGAVQLRPVADTTGRHAFLRVGVRADYTADVEGLSAMLLNLERGPVRLRVRELTVTPTDPFSPRTRAEMLHGDIVVEGLALRVVRHPGVAP
jgi:hypothetical protein